jgi:NADPH-dependent 2,4-dienoyl-CoA reductase/sulfur reductase-like enzyme
LKSHIGKLLAEIFEPGQPNSLAKPMSKPEGYPFIGEPTGIKVIVVGAGLGGLACAIECRRKGHEVIVFENAPEITRIGTFPNF